MQLNKEQELAVHHVEGPMLVLAGPGSGKTFVLTNRIKSLIEESFVPPDNILVITFSKAAAQSMQHRFNALCNVRYPVTFGTFHAVFFHILTYHGLYSKDGILDTKTKYKYIKRVGQLLKISKASDWSWQKDMLEKISCYKNVGDVFFTEDSQSPMDEDEISEFNAVFGEYQKLCRENRVLDFDDMVYECRELLLKNEGVRCFWQGKFRYILIDEFQDINMAQYDVLRLICSTENYGNIFAVGDDDQSIYGFRGAAPGIMKKFLEDYAPCKVVNLQLNYRCAYEIVSLADKSIHHNTDRIERQMQKTLKNRKRGFTYIESFEAAEKEANYIVEELKKYPFDDVAIIYRSNHCISVLEDRLRVEGINYTKNSPKISLYELDMVKLVISYIRIACNKAAKEDFLRCMNSPERGISREALNIGRFDEEDTALDGFRVIKNYYMSREAGLYSDIDKSTLGEIEKWEEDCRMLCKLPAPASLNYMFLGIGLKKYIENNYKIDFRYPLKCEELIDELKERFLQFETIEAIIDFVDSINLKIRKNDLQNEVNSRAPSVTLMSAHASKGLEYPVVFVVGLQDGLFPHHKYMNSKSRIEEERRLFYVAMTRAQDVLYLCGRGSEHGKRVSRFIDELKIQH